MYTIGTKKSQPAFVCFIVDGMHIFKRPVSLHNDIKAVTLIPMILDNKYTMPYTVPSAAIDGQYRCTPLTVAALSQDLAANHYSSTGIFMPQLQERGLMWIISKQHFEIHEYPL